MDTLDRETRQLVHHHYQGCFYIRLAPSGVQLTASLLKLSANMGTCVRFPYLQTPSQTSVRGNPGWKRPMGGDVWLMGGDV
jgi:hypothetical protein